MSAPLLCDRRDPSRPSCEAPSPSVPQPSTLNSQPARFCLPKAIADYIAERDKSWGKIKGQIEALDYGLLDTPLDQVGAAIDRLVVANGAARKMVELTPGPNTPVLDPLRAKVEQLLCNACDIFIDLARRHLRAAHKGQAPVHPTTDIPTLADITPFSK